MKCKFRFLQKEAKSPFYRKRCAVLCCARANVSVSVSASASVSASVSASASASASASSGQLLCYAFVAPHQGGENLPKKNFLIQLVRYCSIF